MKTLLLCFLCGLLGLSSLASDGKKNTGIPVQGKVVDAGNHETLPGAEVVIESLGLKTYCDVDGRFSFDALPPGEYKAKVRYISYQHTEFVLTVKPHAYSEIQLELREL